MKLVLVFILILALFPYVLAHSAGPAWNRIESATRLKNSAAAPLGAGTAGGPGGPGGPGGGGGPPPFNSNAATCSTSPTSRGFSATYSGSGPVATLNVRGTGCPGYDWTSQRTPNTATYQCTSNTIPANPILNSNPIYINTYYNRNGTKANTNWVGGTIGLTVNGVAIFSIADANGYDAYVNEGNSFDTCNGHPAPSGAYHFHVQPKQNCVYTDSPGQHSPLFGVYYDGIPIFGVNGDGGTPPTTLDVCGGHTDQSYPYYHYHISNNYTYPYLANCLRGCINGTWAKNIGLAPSVDTTCYPDTVQYDYSLFKTLLTSYSSSNYACTTNASNAVSFWVMWSGWWWTSSSVILAGLLMIVVAPDY